MKRYNVHLPSEWNEKLDEITKKINRAMNKDYAYGYTKKADTIRMAIAIVYNLEMPFSYGGNKERVKMVRKIFLK